MTKRRYMGRNAECRMMNAGSASVADVEPSEFPARLGLGDVDAADEAFHLALQCVGQRVQIFVVTLGDHLNASVREVADVAGHRMVAGQVLGRVPESHALHVAAEGVRPPLHVRQDRTRTRHPVQNPETAVVISSRRIATAETRARVSAAAFLTLRSAGSLGTPGGACSA